MQQRNYLVVGTVVLLAITGIVFTFFPSFKNTGVAEPEIALSPYVEFEGTVVSLLDKGSYNGGIEIASAPNDSAVVRIDRIIETGGSSNFNWASIGIEEGKEVSLNFTYTARPTRIITVVGETKQSGDTVSHTVVPTKITFEDGFFVFKIDGNSETETILPGLQEGSKFKAKVWQTFEVKVEKYKILSQS